MRQVSFKDRQVGLTAARGDIWRLSSSMSTLNFAEELDFRLIFEDDGRQTAGNLRVILATLVSNLSTALS